MRQGSAQSWSWQQDLTVPGDLEGPELQRLALQIPTLYRFLSYDTHSTRYQSIDALMAIWHLGLPYLFR